MYCIKCGHEITEGIFCPNCGAKVENATQTENVTSSVEKKVENINNNAEIKKPVENEKIRKPFPIKILVLGAVIVIALIAVLTVISNRKTTVSLDKYANVCFEGYDTVGTASIEIDWNGFSDKYASKLKVDKKALKKYVKEELGDDYNKDYMEDYLQYFEENDVADIFSQLLYGELDKYNQLSNGDTVKFSWNLYEEDLNAIESVFACKLKYSEELEFEVENLESVGTFDPFTSINVVFSGTAPNGTAQIEYLSDEYIYDIRYDLSKSSGLSNGDSITVSATPYNSGNSFVNQYGKLPSPTEKQFTVEGLISYVSTASEISEDGINKLKSQAEDVIASYVANQWNDYDISSGHISHRDLESSEYQGCYFLTNKGNAYDQNRIALIYKLTSNESITSEEGELTVLGKTESYYYVQFSNLLIENNGTVQNDITRYTTPQVTFKVEHKEYIVETWLGGVYPYFLYNGFDSIDGVYNEIVSKNVESYNYEENIIEQ